MERIKVLCELESVVVYSQFQRQIQFTYSVRTDLRESDSTTICDFRRQSNRLYWWVNPNIFHDFF